MKKSLLIGCLSIIGLLSARASLISSESFSYADGSIISAPGSPWVTHSGVAGQVNVLGGRAVLTEAETEDVSLPLGGGPYASGNLYAGFTVNFSVLPSGVGNYFASFRNETFDFKTRVHASTVGAVPGFFRIGIANQAASSDFANFVPMDLSLNTDYHVVIRYKVGVLVEAMSSVWVNPLAESDVLNRSDATDSPGTFPSIEYFSLRQSLTTGNGMGTLRVDNLKVGTDFASVVPEPHSSLLLGVALLAGWRSRRNLRAAWKR